MRKHWTENDIPDQTGKVAIVTGANSGIGWETARALAQKGALVVLACRDLTKAESAAARIKATGPAGEAVVMRLDLADLDSVRDFAKAFRNSHRRLDVLVNNAGVGEVPYGRTAQGFETHFGVNHLGHFALTGRLLDPLEAAGRARVVTVSSLMHRAGNIDFDDLNWERRYPAQFPYARSKLANLLFSLELQRRLTAAGRRTMAVAVHPGWSDTQMTQKSMLRFVNRTFAQKAEMGALPTLYAATAEAVRGGEYVGPNGLFGFRGYPKVTGSSARSRDAALARRLWVVSEELTGMAYRF